MTDSKDAGDIHIRDKTRTGSAQSLVSSGPASQNRVHTLLLLLRARANVKGQTVRFPRVQLITSCRSQRGTESVDPIMRCFCVHLPLSISSRRDIRGYRALLFASQFLPGLYLSNLDARGVGDGGTWYRDCPFLRFLLCHVRDVFGCTG